MRISKYVHSCLVLEEHGEQLLFDPGHFSFIEGRVRLEDFRAVSTVVLTHAHPDHVDVAALKRIVALSGAEVVANSTTAAELDKEGLHATVVEDNTYTKGAFTVRALAAPHESILSGSLPQNTAFLVNETILNPGDSFSPALTAYAGTATLILPVIAPWLTEVAAFRFAAAMRPQLAVPVHDGYVKEFFLHSCYDRYESYLARSGIRFARLLEPGDAIEAA